MTHTYVRVSGGKKFSFFGKLDVLCFLQAPVLRFALLAYYQRNLSFSRYTYVVDNFEITYIRDDYKKK